MSRIFMYGHGGSENHGCEAIVRSTVQLLGDNEFFLISSNPDEDKKYGINQLCEIIPEKNKIHKNDFDFIKALVKLKLKNDFVSMDRLLYKDSFGKIKPGDIALSIGGDNYCYADVNRYIMLHDLAKKQGAITVLWGCSVEPSLLKDGNIASDLHKYDYIFARESISYEALKTVNSNIVLMPDPAFLLNKEVCDVPAEFKANNTVGINVSPMVIDKEKKPGIVINNYKNLIDYIVKHTEFNIALIPHVVWEDNNDYQLLSSLYEYFKETERVVLVDDQNCSRLKYIISQCNYFVGARTHSTIAAYSSCIPTIVVGYSVKARGIAHDIFGEDESYVISSDDLVTDGQLANKFISLQQNTKTVKDKMETYNSKLSRRYEEGCKKLYTGKSDD